MMCLSWMQVRDAIDHLQADNFARWDYEVRIITRRPDESVSLVHASVPHGHDRRSAFQDIRVDVVTDLVAVDMALNVAADGSVGCVEYLGFHSRPHQVLDHSNIIMCHQIVSATSVD